MTWISVKERLPDEEQWIVAGNDKDSISFQDSCWAGRFVCGDIETKEFSVNLVAEFTHWQPLPEPPQVSYCAPARLESALMVKPEPCLKCGTSKSRLLCRMHIREMQQAFREPKHQYAEC